MYPFPSEAARISAAFARAPFIPFSPGVSTSFALDLEIFQLKQVI